MQGVLLIGLVPVLLVYRSTAKYSQLATVLLQRVESVTRAPVFANFTETLHGITTIRAFRRQASVTERNERMLNLNDRPYFLKQLAMMWMGVRLDFLGSLVSFAVAAIVVANRIYDWDLVPLAWAAVALTSAQQLTKSLQMVVILTTYMESESAWASHLLLMSMWLWLWLWLCMPMLHLPHRYQPSCVCLCACPPPQWPTCSACTTTSWTATPWRHQWTSQRPTPAHVPSGQARVRWSSVMSTCGTATTRWY